VRGKALGRFRVRGERLIKLGYSWFSAKPIKVGPFHTGLTRVEPPSWTPGVGNYLPVLLDLRIVLTRGTSQNVGAKADAQKGNSPEPQLRTLNPTNGESKAGVRVDPQEVGLEAAIL